MPNKKKPILRKNGRRVNVKAIKKRRAPSKRNFPKGIKRTRFVKKKSTRT
jgi:hypothetical protein